MEKKLSEYTPPEGTSTDDILANELFQYCVNGPQAKERIQIRLGSCLTEEGFTSLNTNRFLHILVMIGRYQKKR